MSTFQKLYEENAKKLYGYLFSLTGNKTLAEELLQETFFQALKSFEKFEGRCSVYTWLCQIGKNAWRKKLNVINDMQKSKLIIYNFKTVL